MTDTTPCDECGEATTGALARTIRLTVDRTQVDTRRLCPDCFAGWIDRYEREMQTEPDDDSEFIVD